MEDDRRREWELKGLKGNSGLQKKKMRNEKGQVKRKRKGKVIGIRRRN
jgi:hypothetical protein